MRVRFAQAAQRDFLELLDHLSKVNLRAAETVERRVFEAACALAEHPRQGVAVPHAEPEDLRKLILPPYILFHTVDPDLITVVRILHGARDLASLLREQNFFDPS